ncbi:hypothetical protein [Mycobacterium aquaticum]|uniref:hypothetical protein n=1 Tax=Mycobacterium aquaticum TaxID=1927124 RepID=UPI00114ED566|nr:hypothetical protein [Mycobacterium aquaticum]
MKILVALVGTSAAAAAFACIGFVPSAAAEPACPYDMSTQAGKDALQQAIVASSQRVGEHQQQYGPNGDLELATQDINDQRNMSNVILACQGVQSTPLAPVELPQQPQLPPAVDTAPSVDGSCQQLSDAWSNLDYIVPAADRFAELKKVPGLGLVSAAQLIGCGISDIPTAIMNPSRENQSDVFSGFCNGVNNMIPFPIGDPCGNTRAG